MVVSATSILPSSSHRVASGAGSSLAALGGGCGIESGIVGVSGASDAMQGCAAAWKDSWASPGSRCVAGLLSLLAMALRDFGRARPW